MAIADLTSLLITNHVLPPLLLGIITSVLIWRKYAYQIQDIPGPPVAAYTGLWRFFNLLKGHAEIDAVELHRKYGPLVRIGPKHVSVGDPSAITQIYGLKTTFQKTGFYPAWTFSWKKKFMANLFSTTDEQVHRKLKKKTGNAYSPSALLESEAGIDDCANMFVSRLDGFISASQPVDLGAWLQYYAFDAIGVFTYGKPIGFLKKGGDVGGMLGDISTLFTYCTAVGFYPLLDKFLLGNPWLPYLLPVEKYNTCLNFTVNSMNARVAQNKLEKENSRAKPDMCSKWTFDKGTGDGEERMNDPEIVQALTGNVVAGSDTTAIALRAIIYYLCRNPDKMSKAVQEIDAADRAGLLSKYVQFRESTTHLPYFEAVMKEAMRLHSSIGLMLERCVPPGGANICGHHMPAGTIVGVNPWVVHRNAAVFTDPDLFVPERWIESSEAQLREMDRATFNFGGGAHTCIGKNMSLMEMKKIVPQLLREFQIELVDPSKNWETRNWWFVQQEGLLCRLERRSQK